MTFTYEQNFLFFSDRKMFRQIQFFLLTLQIFIQLSEANPDAAAKYDNQLRYSSKSSQASPGLYFDPESGTFRSKPPAAPLQRSLSQEELSRNAADKDIIKEEVEDIEAVQESVPSMNSRGAKLAAQASQRQRSRGRSVKVEKKYQNIVRTPSTRPSSLSKSRLRSRARLRARKLNREKDENIEEEEEEDEEDLEDSEVSASRHGFTKYQHFDDPSDVILPTRTNQYLREHSAKHNFNSRLNYDYMIGGDSAYDWESNEVDNVEAMTYGPLNYDYAISGRGEEDFATTRRPSRASTVRAEIRKIVTKQTTRQRTTTPSKPQQ